MATLEQRIRDGNTRLATEAKRIRTLLNGNAQDNLALTTAAKTNLVAAINELKALADSLAASGGATINDASTTSTTQTYSIDKIRQSLVDQSVQIKNDILGGAAAARDTLQELSDLLDGEAAQITTIMTALGNRVRTDTAAQGLSTGAKQNARTNIDAYGSVEIGNPDANFVDAIDAALAS
jgi:hypothetical protein